MMKKIVLFYPKLEPHKDFHYMPLSALAVASTLIAQGHEVKIVDDRVCSNPEATILEELEDTLMISVYTGYQVTRAYHISSFIKTHRPEIKIIWGGPHVSALSEQTLNAEVVDYIYPGYAEHGEYPLPWYLLNLKDYVNPKTNRFIYVSTYSCPGVCTFCATKNKRKWIELPIEKVEKDIDNLMNLHKFEECVFFDATIFTNHTRVKILSKIMKKHGLRWIADARSVELLKMSEDTLAELIDSGLTQLTIGLESGSDRVVQRMRKGKNHLKEYEEVSRKLAKLPLKIVSGVIFGTPGETPEDLEATIGYIKRMKQINPNLHISTTFFMPLPDTIMADLTKVYGYQEPSSLAEWAHAGEQGHFKYNEWMNNPWIVDVQEYQRLYDEFIKECDYLI